MTRHVRRAPRYRPTKLCACPVSLVTCLWKGRGNVNSHVIRVTIKVRKFIVVEYFLDNVLI